MLQGNGVAPLTLRAYGGRPGVFVTVTIAPEQGNPDGSLALVASATEEEHTLFLKPGRYRVTVEALVYRFRRRTSTIDVSGPLTLTVRVGRLGMRVTVDLAAENA